MAGPELFARSFSNLNAFERIAPAKSETRGRILPKLFDNHLFRCRRFDLCSVNRPSDAAAFLCTGERS